MVYIGGMPFSLQSVGFDYKTVDFITEQLVWLRCRAAPAGKTELRTEAAAR